MRQRRNRHGSRYDRPEPIDPLATNHPLHPDVLGKPCELDLLLLALISVGCFDVLHRHIDRGRAGR